jgi:two-component system NtrC family sensor kinase
MDGSAPHIEDLVAALAALEAEAAELRARHEADQAALEELRGINRRFRTAFQTSFMFQGFLTLGGILLDTNETSLRAVDAELRDVVGLPFWETPWFTQDKNAVRDCVRRAAGGETARVHLIENWPTGHRTIVLSIRPCVDEQGRPDVLIAEGYETTALLAAEEKLHQSEKLAALGSLLAGVAHELNNPLAIVVTQAVLLREKGTDAATIARAEKIEAAASRCARIVKSFLSIARQRPISRGPVKLDAVVQAALDLTVYGLRSNGVAVSVDIPSDLPEVMGDADQLGQVCMNLIVNALHALQTTDGPRKLRVTAAADKDEVRLTFADNGPGVPNTIKSRIYDPFFTTKPVGTGTGIGLSLCQSIVRQHEGSLALQDTPDGGATFILTLPLAGHPTLEVPAERDVKTPLPGAAILIVDDEPEIVAALREIVAPLSRRVDTAETGRAALQLTALYDYDVIFSDLRMPDLDGPGLHASLATGGSDQHHRIVFMTGDVLDGRISQFLESTGLQVLEKPFTPEEARRVVVASMSDPQASAS